MPTGQCRVRRFDRRSGVIIVSSTTSRASISLFIEFARPSAIELARRNLSKRFRRLDIAGLRPFNRRPPDLRRPNHRPANHRPVTRSVVLGGVGCEGSGRRLDHPQLLIGSEFDLEKWPERDDLKDKRCENARPRTKDAGRALLVSMIAEESSPQTIRVSDQNGEAPMHTSGLPQASGCRPGGSMKGRGQDEPM